MQKENKLKNFILWAIVILICVALVAVIKYQDSYAELYNSGIEAGKKAGLTVGYNMGMNDGSTAGGKNGAVDGELLLQFGNVTQDSEPRAVPEAEIDAPEIKEIFVSAGIMAFVPSYAEGYQEGYVSSASEGYVYGYKSGYKESYKQTYWIYEEQAEKILAEEQAEAERQRAYAVASGSSGKENKLTSGSGDNEAPPQYYAPVAEECDYVLNKNTMKFHYPSCSSASQIKESNREYFTGSREEVIARGFSPCGRCHP